MNRRHEAAALALEDLLPRLSRGMSRPCLLHVSGSDNAALPCLLPACPCPTCPTSRPPYLPQAKKKNAGRWRAPACNHPRGGRAGALARAAARPPRPPAAPPARLPAVPVSPGRRGRHPAYIFAFKLLS